MLAARAAQIRKIGLDGTHSQPGEFGQVVIGAIIGGVRPRRNAACRTHQSDGLIDGQTFFGDIGPHAVGQVARKRLADAGDLALIDEKLSEIASAQRFRRSLDRVFINGHATGP